MKRIIVEFEGRSLPAELFDERSPKLCGSILDLLPVEGRVTNTFWSGEMLRLWIQIPEPDVLENVITLHNPGDILFNPGWNGLRFVYGQAMMQGPGGAHPIPCVGRMLDGVADLAAYAKKIEWEGAGLMRLRKA